MKEKEKQIIKRDTEKEKTNCKTERSWNKDMN